MNINKEHKFIFIHIPKNGGTSIARSLGFNLTTHHTAIQIKQSLTDTYKDYFVFAFYRDPIERFLSLYNYARMPISYYHNNLDPSNSIYGKHLDYEFLSQKSVNMCVYHLLKGHLKHDENWNHWLPQSNWVLDNDGNMICNLYDINNLKLFSEDFKNRFNIEIQINNFNKSDKSHDSSKLSFISKLLLHYKYRTDYKIKRFIK